jgi:hypothetical protein
VSAPFDASERRPQNDQGTERQTLISYLNYQRDTLRWKAAGLTADQLAARAIPSTSMSLLGLIRHVADVERAWGDRVFGRTRPRYYEVDGGDQAFEDAVADQTVVDDAYRNWAEGQIDFDASIAHRDLGDLFVADFQSDAVSIRSLLCHMIEEYARHNGHADLLREAVDGATGE